MNEPIHSKSVRDFDVYLVVKLGSNSAGEPSAKTSITQEGTTIVNSFNVNNDREMIQIKHISKLDKNIISNTYVKIVNSVKEIE